MKNKVLFILKKELREVFRDKKSLLMMLIIPLMIPAVIIGISYLFDADMNSSENKYNKIGFTYELSDVEKDLAKNMKIDYTVATTKEMKKLYDEEKVYLYIEKKEYQKELDKYNALLDKATQKEAKSIRLLICEMYIKWACDVAKTVLHDCGSIRRMLIASLNTAKGNTKEKN